jgi:hypothetical protein
MNADAKFTETSHAEMKPMSAMAVTAFVLTLLFCIPVLPLVGLFLGLAALGRTSTDGLLRGRPLAITAIILGVLMTTLWIVVIYFGPTLVKSAFFPFYGPPGSVQAAFDGDTAEATSFWWNGTAPSEAETAAFVAAANAKCGAFKGVVFNEKPELEAGFGQSEFAMPFIFTFSNGKFDGEVFFSATQAGEMTASGSYLGIDKVVIKDPDGADLVWDAADAGSSTPADSSGTAPDETTGKPAAEKSAEKMDDQSPPSDP